MRILKNPWLVLTVLLLAAVWTASAAADSPLAGKWEGEVENPALQFTLIFQESGGHYLGKLTMPANGIEDLSLESIEFDGSRLRFVVPNQDQPIQCEAARNEDGSFSGTYKLGDQDGNFTMRRVEG